MHDIRFVRDNPEAFDQGLQRRGLAPVSAEILEVDKRRRAAISESESTQARRKALLLPDFRNYAIELDAPGSKEASPTATLVTEPSMRHAIRPN